MVIQLYVRTGGNRFDLFATGISKLARKAEEHPKKSSQGSS